MEITTTHLEVQMRATRALLKFCRDHDYESKWIVNVARCLLLLEDGQVADAYAEYINVPLGGNGCFNDWWPPVVFAHEDEEFVWTEFEALCAHWSLMMNLAKKD